MIIVFGAGGFIGTYLTDQLISDGYEIVASDIHEFSKAYFQKRKIPFHHVDLTQQEDFKKLPTSGIKAVVHLACVQPANVSERKYDPADYIKVNVLGTLRILEFCKANKIPKLIYTCSHRNTQGMWEEKAGRPILESDGRSIKYTGDYAMFSISESAASDCVEHYTATYGLDGIVLRIPPVYGYGPHTEIFKDGKPIKTGFQIFIDNAKQGLPIELWGDPQIGRDIVYVKDLVSAIGLAIRKPAVRGLYNISSGRKLSLKEQAESIIRIFSPSGTPSEIRYRPEKNNHIESYVYSIDKARRELSWAPQYSFEDMLIDYQKEMDLGRFNFLVEKRRKLLQGA